MLWVIFLNVWLGALAVVAWRTGGSPERIGVNGLIVWLVGDYLYRLVADTPQFATVDMGLFALDMMLAGTLASIALSANRSWPFFASAAAVVQIVGHFAATSGPAHMAVAYWTMNQVPIILIFIALSAGIYSQSRRRSARKRVRSWSFQRPWFSSILDHRDGRLCRGSRNV